MVDINRRRSDYPRVNGAEGSQYDCVRPLGVEFLSSTVNGLELLERHTYTKITKRFVYLPKFIFRMMTLLCMYKKHHGIHHITNNVEKLNCVVRFELPNCAH